MIAASALAAVEPKVFLIVLAGLAMATLVGIVLRAAVVRIPANRVLVLPGKGDEPPRCHHGGLVFVMPFSRRLAWMELEPFRFVYPLPDPLGEYDVRVGVAIGTEPHQLQVASEQILSLTRAQLSDRAEALIGEAVRETVRNAAPLSCDNATLARILADVETSLPSRLAAIGMVPLTVTIPAPAAFVPTHRVLKE